MPGLVVEWLRGAFFCCGCERQPQTAVRWMEAPFLVFSQQAVGSSSQPETEERCEASHGQHPSLLKNFLEDGSEERRQDQECCVWVVFDLLQQEMHRRFEAMRHKKLLPLERVLAHSGCSWMVDKPLVLVDDVLHGVQ